MTVNNLRGFGMRLEQPLIEYLQKVLIMKNLLWGPLGSLDSRWQTLQGGAVGEHIAPISCRGTTSFAGTICIFAGVAH